jgi:hypothetical protein
MIKHILRQETHIIENQFGCTKEVNYGSQILAAKTDGNIS